MSLNQGVLGLQPPGCCSQGEHHAEEYKGWNAATHLPSTFHGRQGTRTPSAHHFTLFFFWRTTVRKVL
eukprot:5029783-Amphidinium_carterae.1